MKKIKENLNLALLAMLISGLVISACSSSKKEDDSPKSADAIAVTGVSSPTGS